MSSSSEQHDCITWKSKTGFPALSKFLTSDDDKFMMVFQRFDDLAAQNLVYLQSQLEYLERQIHEINIDDEYNTNPGSADATIRKQGLVDWTTLAKDTRKMELIKEIRVSLRDYRQALLQESALYKLDMPTRQTHGAIMHKIKGNQPTYGYTTEFFKAPAHTRALYRDRKGLVSLRSPTFEDGITSFVDTYFARFFKTTGEESGIYQYSHDKVIRAANVASAILAVLAMALPIWGLYAIRQYVSPRYASWIQLTMMTFCTLSFVITLGLVMNIRRGELFGAAATYLAVLVVFLNGL